MQSMDVLQGVRLDQLPKTTARIRLIVKRLRFDETCLEGNDRKNSPTGIRGR